jgi:hypothetical protein
MNLNLKSPIPMFTTKKNLFFTFPIILFFLGINSAFSQIDLGSIEDFTLFTTIGAVDNTPTATGAFITGDIGTDTGAITGFGSPTVINGSIHNPNAITAQAVLDLTSIVDQINNTVTTATHLPVFGNGETLTPGVYYVEAAGSIAGTLILDGQNDANAQFIFKIGAAFSPGVNSKVVLINCALPANIFWLANGAISIGAGTEISGNLIADTGAVGIVGEGGKVEGRMLSTTGAIAVYGTEVTNPGIPLIGPITQPTCTTTTGSFQIGGYDPNIANQYIFTPSVESVSTEGLVIANPDTYTFTFPNSVGCSGLLVITVPTNYWTGVISSDWNVDGNWTCGVPSNLNDWINIIPVVTTVYPIIGAEPDNSGIAKNLEIQDDASLTIDNNTLRLTTILTLNGKIDLEGEAQLLQDTGSIIDVASTGSLEITQQGTGNSFRYNYWSSPVNSRGTEFTIGEVLRDGTDPNNIIDIVFGAPYTYADGLPSSAIKLSSYWMYKLEDSGLGYSAWASVENTGEVKVGQGYSMKGSNTSEAEQNYTFEGKPNNGVIELTVSANNYHLVGNPYPSAIDADKFIDDNGSSPGTESTTGPIYYWEHYGGDTHTLSGYQGGYATYTKSGGVKASSSPGDGVSSLGESVKGEPERYIPVGQGFFVVGDVDGGQIQFNNSQRVFEKESSGNSIFMRTDNSKSTTTNNSGDDLRPKFRIGFDAPQIDHRQILLTLDENTTDAIDWGYDAEMLEVFDDDMYWVIDDKKYVIQATNEFGFDKEIPLGIQTKEGGLIRIKIDKMENTEEYPSLYIKDDLTGETHDITNQPFEINLEAGEYQNRFSLVTQVIQNITEEVTLLDGVQVYMNNSISELQLNRLVDTEILNVSVFNYLGQQLKTWSINTDERLISLPLQIVTGAYIVKVETTNGKINKKIIIN